MSRIHIVVCLVALAGSSSLESGRQPAAAACTEWRDCRTQTLDAIAGGEFERAHDLAWRAVQTGPPADPDLMLLLARAQSLFRPQDALVMLQRLADRGVRLDVGHDPDFARTRALAGWPAVEAAIDGAASRSSDPPAPAPAAAETKVPVETGANATSLAAGSVVHGALEEAIRFSADPFIPGGIAYDGVSRRFVFGDRDGRKLRVVGEGLPSAADLVGASSAGFFAVQAIDIDRRRGDLWVATADPASGDAAIHKLQLISGRLLTIFPAATSLTPMAIVDLAVTPSGGVLGIDAEQGRVVRIRAGASRLESLVALEQEGATSIALGAAEGVAYVAHRDGILRVNVSGRSAVPLTAPKGVSLGGFERLRRHGGALVGIRAGPDGVRRIVRLELAANGRRVARATVYDTRIPGAKTAPAITVVGDDLCFIGSLDSEAVSNGAVDRIVHRVNLEVR